MTTEEYIYERTLGLKKNSPENTEKILAALGDPQDGIKIIHVAGTNGKGSCCAYTDGILRCSGEKAGLFTSPHLIRMNERIKADGKDIPDAELLRLSKKVFDAAESSGAACPTFFELMFMTALLYFREEGVSFAVIEAGMGGLNDATNVLKAKAASVITSVGMDHMQYLGDDIRDIAGQKAGIMRKGVPCYYYASGEAEDVLLKEAEDIGAVPVKLSDGMMTDCAAVPGQVDFFLSYGYHKLCISLKGDALYQRINASLAAMFALDHGAGDEAVIQGIAGTLWPGRLEEIRPGFYLDGAHNVPAVKALRETLERTFSGREKLLIFGASSDKDIKGMLEVIKDLGKVRGIIFSKTAYARMEDPERIMDAAARCGIGCDMSVMSPGDALREALGFIKEDKDRMGIAFGSFYLTGDIRRILEEDK